MANQFPGRELALIVGAARSGTTLLRMILDAHREVGCPAEAGLPALMSHMAGVWVTVDADVTETGSHHDDPGTVTRGGDGDMGIGVLKEGVKGQLATSSQLPVEARRWIRACVREPMQRYCGRGGKRLYVDKSLDSVFYLPLVRELFPSLCYDPGR